jgi:TrmH family RNA methyltransferase
MLTITSTDNPRVKLARRLRERRGRAKQAQFLLEGIRLVRDAVQSGVQPEVIFFVPDQLAEQETATTLLAELQQRGVECLACTPAVLATLAETVTPQGIVAVMPWPALPWPVNAKLTLILDQVRDPGNAGTLLRSAEAAGVDGVIFAPESVDPFNDKSVRAGMGAHFRLPLRVCGTWSAVRALLTPEPPIYIATAEAVRAYDQVDWRQSVALIIGGEATGASNEARSLAQPLTIPMHGRAESLNAAIAGAIILFEAARQRRNAPPAIDSNATCG